MKAIMQEWREFVTEQNNREVGSCIIVDNKDRVLILLRGSTDPWKPGWWDLPGGHLDGDEMPMEGAAREAEEEAGLTVRNLQKVGMKPIGRMVKYFFVTRDYDGSVSLKPNPKTGIVEHDEYKWATIEELADFRESLVPVNMVRKALNLVRV
jgi:8-oxo-dGTP pyrophosphatase MutT (NUDIX family)